MNESSTKEKPTKEWMSARQLKQYRIMAQNEGIRPIKSMLAPRGLISLSPFLCTSQPPCQLFFLKCWSSFLLLHFHTFFTHIEFHTITLTSPLSKFGGGAIKEIHLAVLAKKTRRHSHSEGAMGVGQSMLGIQAWEPGWDVTMSSMISQEWSKSVNGYLIGDERELFFFVFLSLFSLYSQLSPFIYISSRWTSVNKPSPPSFSWHHHLCNLTLTVFHS